MRYNNYTERGRTRSTSALPDSLKKSWELELVKELGFGAECARSWDFTNCEGAGFFRAEKLEIGNPQGTGTFSKCFISKSKAKLKLEMKSKWQITLPSSDKVEVKILGIVWQLTLLEDK